MRVKLEDVCERGSSNLKQSDVVELKGDYPVYGASGCIGSVDFYHQENSYVAVVKDGAGIGRTTLHPAKSSVIGTMQYLLPKNNVLPEYLYYVVSYMHLEKYFTGATIPHIYFKDYKNEKFNLDSVDTQKQVVDVLGKCEAVIESRKRELQLLDNLIKARFVEMFGDPLSNPMRWRETILRTVCSKITDGEHGSVPRVEIGHPFLNAKHVLKNGLIDWASVSFTDDEVHEKLCRRCSPEKNDILMTTTGTIGNIAIVPDMESFSMDRGITLLKLDYELVDSVFIACMLRFDGIQALMQSNVHASAIGHLFLNKVEQIPIILPPLDMQRQFADFVRQVDKSKFVKQKVRIRTINSSSINAVIRI